MLRLPSVGLHTHLGGSRPRASIKLAQMLEHGIHDSSLDFETLREIHRFQRFERHQTHISKTDLYDDAARDTYRPNGLERYIEAEERIPSLKRNVALAYEATNMLMWQLASQNKRYVELRTNPFPKCSPHTAEDYIRMIQEGADDAKLELEQVQKKIDYGLILLAYRHGDDSINPETGRKRKVDEAIKVAETAIELRQKGYPIVGIDLAGGEADNPVTDFGPYFDVIKAYNKTAKPEERLGITIHAGETHHSGHLSGSESVRKAIELAWDENTPVRIGHGIQAAKDPDLMKLIQEKGIGLEMCPKSNVQTEAVEWYSDHPALELSRSGDPVSLDGDNLTVSNTTGVNEFVKLFIHPNRQNQRALHEDRKRMVLAGLETAFIHDPEQRAEMIREVKAQFAEIERDPRMQVAIHKERNGGQEPSTLRRHGIVLQSYVRNLLNELGQALRELGQRIKGLFKTATASQPG